MAIRCTAHRTSGEPCGNYSIEGARVCRYHGGSAPAVREAARRRVEEAALLREARMIQETEHAQQVADQAARKLLGPRYVWEWQSPRTLRKVAAELRKYAAELTALASANNGR